MKTQLIYCDRSGRRSKSTRSNQRQRPVVKRFFFSFVSFYSFVRSNLSRDRNGGSPLRNELHILLPREPFPYTQHALFRTFDSYVISIFFFISSLRYPYPQFSSFVVKFFNRYPSIWDNCIDLEENEVSSLSRAIPFQPPIFVFSWFLVPQCSFIAIFVCSVWVFALNGVWGIEVDTVRTQQRQNKSVWWILSRKENELDSKYQQRLALR